MKVYTNTGELIGTLMGTVPETQVGGGVGAVEVSMLALVTLKDGRQKLFQFIIGTNRPGENVYTPFPQSLLVAQEYYFESTDCTGPPRIHDSGMPRNGPAAIYHVVSYADMDAIVHHYTVKREERPFELNSFRRWDTCYSCSEAWGNAWVFTEVELPFEYPVVLPVSFE